MRQEIKELTFEDKAITDVVQIYKMIISSPNTTRLIVDRSMKLLSSYESISQDPLRDGIQAKQKLLQNSGYGLLMQALSIVNEEERVMADKLRDLLSTK